MHEDADGVPRVVFVMNPSPQDLVTRVSIRGARALDNLLTPERSDAHVKRGIAGFEVAIPARTVRMFAVSVSPPGAPSQPALPPV